MVWEKTWVPICEVCQCFWTHRDAPFWSDGRQESHRPRCPGSYFFSSLPAYDPHPRYSLLPSLFHCLHICAEDHVSSHTMTLTATNQSAFGRVQRWPTITKPTTAYWDTCPGMCCGLDVKLILERLAEVLRGPMCNLGRCVFHLWLCPVLKSLFSDKIRVTRPTKRIKLAFYSSRKYQQGGDHAESKEIRDLLFLPFHSLTPRQAWSVQRNMPEDVGDYLQSLAFLR